DATRYQLRVGSAAGLNDLGTRSTNEMQAWIRNLPTDGDPVFVSLRYLSSDGRWRSGESMRLLTPNWPPLRIASHQPGIVLASADVTFGWAANPDANRYQVRVGTEAGGDDLGKRSSSDLEVEILGLPTDGREVFVTLRYRGSDGRWRSGDAVRLLAAN
ncbi:MAG: hypothetical protein AAF499_13665, partial [Pseudomonadota bacterium]